MMIPLLQRGEGRDLISCPQDQPARPRFRGKINIRQPTSWNTFAEEQAMSKYDGTHSSLTISLPAVSPRSLPMWKVFRSILKFVLGAVLALAAAAAVAETPKRGGI